MRRLLVPGKKFPPDQIPYFSYDRKWTNQSIRQRLVDPGSKDWLDTTAWIMREAAGMSGNL